MNMFFLGRHISLVRAGHQTTGHQRTGDPHYHRVCTDTVQDSPVGDGRLHLAAVVQALRAAQVQLPDSGQQRLEDVRVFLHHPGQQGCGEDTHTGSLTIHNTTIKKI